MEDCRVLLVVDLSHGQTGLETAVAFTAFPSNHGFVIRWLRSQGVHVVMVDRDDPGMSQELSESGMRLVVNEWGEDAETGLRCFLRTLAHDNEMQDGKVNGANPVS